MILIMRNNRTHVVHDPVSQALSFAASDAHLALPQFPRERGEKARSSFKMFLAQTRPDGTDDSSKPNEVVSENIHEGQEQVQRNGTFDLALTLAKRHAIPLEEVRQKLEEYRTLDVDGDESLTFPEFTEAVRRICKLAPGQAVPKAMLARHEDTADKDGDGKIDFEEFLLWSLRHSYNEDLIAPDRNEKQLRRFARQINVHMLDVDKAKAIFDEFDTDRSGAIEREEFKEILCRLSNIKPNTLSDLSTKRLWHDADRLNRGKLTFFQFATWFFKQHLKGRGQES